MTENTGTGRYQIIRHDGESDIVIAIVNDIDAARAIVEDANARRELGSSDSYRYSEEQTSKAPYEL